MRNPSKLVNLTCISVLMMLSVTWVEAQKEIGSQEILADIIENLELDQNFDQNTLLEDLIALLSDPIDLNNAEVSDFQDFILLTSLQVENLIHYVNTLGPLISIYELQAIPGFDTKTIRRIIPFVTVDEKTINEAVGLREMIANGEHQLFLRSQRILEDKYGFIRDDDGRYLGNPWKKYLRYRYSYGNRMSIGFTKETDSGEPFISEGHGIDYLSFHFFVRNPTPRIKTLAFGDYDINLGQGLTIYNGFAPGKSALAMDIKRSGRIIRPHTSVEEIRFFRGAAATISVTDKWEFTAFVSSRNRDANLKSTNGDTILDAASSLQTSGFHRTLNELEDRASVHSFIIGGNVKHIAKDGEVGINFYSNSFSKPILRSEQLYNQFQWRGDQLTNGSFDYSWRRRNLTFFGESAYSSSGGWAHHHNLLMGLDETVSVGLSYRNFERNYTSLYPGSFAESDGTNNEKGLYLAVDIHPSYHWSIVAYADLFEYPWLRFTTDAPSTGKEYLIRATYRIKRKFEAYLQWKEETKFRNLANNNTPIDYLVPNEKINLRLHCAFKMNQDIELRSRAEWVWWDEQLGNQDNGFLVYQDILYKPITGSISFTARYAWFKTDGFDSRIYTYENDLIYNFSIPSYFDHGSRYYLNVRYDITRLITLEGRFAQTKFRNRESISSGNEAISDDQRTDIKFQLRFRW